MIAWTLPFLWIGVSMTMRRAEDAGRSPFLALLYFVPLVNYATMLILCVLPSRPRTTDPLLGRRAAAARCAARFWASGGPRHRHRDGRRQRDGVRPVRHHPLPGHAVRDGRGGRLRLQLRIAEARGSDAGAGDLTVVAGGAILLFAFEASCCLVMAAPPAIVMALMGAWLGRALAGRPRSGTPASRLSSCPCRSWPRSRSLVLPLRRPRCSRRSRSPPPDVVWRHVVTFSELREPPAWFFRLGIAYPRRATIAGHGVGALRRCEFSTGAFLEPITAWEEPSRLAFDVAAQPPPPDGVEPLSSRRGAAPRRIPACAGRRVPAPAASRRAHLLEGRTFYQMRIFPAAYWRLWSDALIHAIHQRVLGHIQALSEAGPP